GVLGMIQDRDSYRLPAKASAQGTPAAARAPYSGSLLAFTGEIVTGNSCAIRCRDLRHASARIGEGLRLFTRQLQRPRHAQAKHAFFVISKRDLAVESCQRRDSIHAAHAGGSSKNIDGVLTQHWFLVRAQPVCLDFEFAFLGAAPGSEHIAMYDRAHFALVLRLDGVRVVPKINSADVAVVEPETNVMRVVGSLTWSGRKTARHELALSGPKREEHRLLESRRIDV